MQAKFACRIRIPPLKKNSGLAIRYARVCGSRKTHSLSDLWNCLLPLNHVPATAMPAPKVICFRASEAICDTIDRIMDERLIDRTTVIKLALYHFDTYMRSLDVRDKDLFDIVRDLEGAAMPEQICFAKFSMPEKDRRKIPALR